MKTKLFSGLWLITLVGWVSVVWVTSLQADSAAQVIAVGSAVKVTADDGASHDQFGVAVAIDGNRAVIGAEGQDSSSKGAAYLFQSDNGVAWAAAGKFTAPDGEVLDGYGSAVAISAGSDAVMVGAPLDDTPAGGMDSGSVWTFYHDEDNGNATTPVQLLADDAAAGAEFGAAIAIDGDRAVIGAPGANKAYAFTRNPNTDEWSQSGVLTPSEQQSGGRFGTSVALDGETAVVGAEGQFGIVDSGAAFVFTADGNTWTQQAVLLPDAATATDKGFFGASVALQDDTALVGAYFEDSNASAPQSGTAYVFTRNPNDDTWSQQTRLTASDAGTLDSFGYSVALSENVAVIGAPLKTAETRDKSGAVYVFERDLNGNWTQASKLTTDDAAARDALGYSVGLFGIQAIMGAVWDDTFQGAAYIFPVLQAGPDIILVSPTGTENDPNSDLVMTFDEPVFEGNGTIQILNSNNEIVEEMTISDDTVTLEGNQVTINPSTLLNYGETYEIVISEGAFIDNEGAGFPGLGSIVPTSPGIGGGG